MDKAPSVTDPAAKALSELLVSVGLPIPEAWASRAFSFVLVLFIELLAVCGLKAAFAPAEPEQPTAPGLTPGLTPEAPSVAAVHPALIAQPAIYLPRAPTAGQEILDWLALQPAGVDGYAHTSSRKVGAAVGCSAAAANTALHRLHAQGFIDLRTGGGGTYLKILPRQVVTGNPNDLPVLTPG
jgi:hypothetical protein